MTVEAEGRADERPPPSREPDPGRAAGWLRWGPAAVVTLAVIAVVASGAERHLSLTELQQRRSALVAVVHARPILSALAYMGLYLLVVGLSLPGALIMTLTGGFLFGQVWGTAAAVTGASAGAAVMFLVARTALGDALRRRAERSGGLIHRLERAIRANAFVALLSARLMPALPFWTVNLAAALVEMPLKTYLAATVLGILPSTLIYAGVGAGLGRLFDQGRRPDLGMLLQPQVTAPLIGLAVLAGAPLLWKAWRVRRSGRGGAR